MTVVSGPMKSELNIKSSIPFKIIADGNTLNIEPTWFSVKEKLPDKDGWYLCCGDLIEWNMKNGDAPDTYFLCYYSDGWGREILPGMYDEVTLMYWMPLPKLPED